MRQPIQELPSRMNADQVGRIDVDTLPPGNFSPRHLVDGRLIPWTDSVPKQRAIIIQSAIRGGPTFEPAKLGFLQTLQKLDPTIIGVHSYASPNAPEQIVNEGLERASVPFIVANVRQAIDQGWQGVVINDCMADPGLLEVRDLIAQTGANMEIVAPAETSLKSLADRVGKFAIVGVADALPIFERLARTYGVADRLVGVYVDLFLEPKRLHEVGLETVAESLYEKIIEAQKAGANGIVFGCTTLFGTLEELYLRHPELREYTLVEPMPVTLKTAAQTVKKFGRVD